MKRIQDGLTENFGLVGKSLRRYLTTTALTASGLMAIASPAFADNWTDHVADEGSISIDTTMPNTTNITQNTDFVKVHGDGDINAGYTVNVAQPSSSSKYVLYDTEGDPTKIMGTLNANGRIYIFDKNGVIFGEDSQVNVGAIVASTGTVADAQIKAGDKLTFKNVGGEGKIVNKGTITARDAGLTAFVAPGVENSGIINAKVVTFASADKVTLDMYGDNLVNVEVDGALKNALIKNSGQINASGGHVVLTAAAAKDAVDNVINMDGIIDVSSVSSKGGKIVLGGGDNGVVKVSGKLKANGKNGGTVKVTGQNILINDSAVISANALKNGNGGKVDVIAKNGLVMTGKLNAKGGDISGDGGAIETSGKGFVKIYGKVDASATNGANGTWLIDPSNLEINDTDASNVGGNGNGSPFKPDGDTSSVLSRTTLEGALNSGSDVTVTTVGSPDQPGQDGTITLNTDVTKTAGVESTLTLDAAGGIIHNAGKTLSAAAGNVLNVVYKAVNDINIYGIINSNGGDVSATSSDGSITVGSDGAINTVGGNATLAANGEIGFLDYFFGPHTNINVNGVIDAAGGNIALSQTGIFTGAANSLRTSGTGTVALNQNKFTVLPIFSFLSSIELPGFPFDISLGSIQTAIDAIQNTGTGTNTVKVGAGTFDEHIDANVANLILKGANAGIAGNGVRGDETIIHPHSPGVHVTAANTTIDGFLIENTMGADGYGIWVDGVANATLQNNVIRNTSQEGIFANGATSLDINHNKIDSTGQGAILVDSSASDNSVSYNVIGTDMGSIINGDGVKFINAQGGQIFGNRITGTLASDDFTGDDASGVYLLNASNVTVGGTEEGQGNDIYNVDWDGVKVAGGGDNIVVGNTIKDTTRIGIYGQGTNNFSVLSNSVTNANLDGFGGITVLGGQNHTIDQNTVTGAASDADSGIFMALVGGGNNVISRNTIKAIKGDGIVVHDVTNADIKGNIITDTRGNGVTLYTSNGDLIVRNNTIGDADGTTFIDGNGVYLTNLINGTVQGNSIYNTRTFDPISGDDASGVYLDHVSNILVGGSEEGQGNFIRNADWDGVKVADGSNNKVIGNDIAGSTRIGVYGEGTHSVLVDGNKVFDSNLEGYGGITILGGENQTITDNDVSDAAASKADAGIYLALANGGDNVISGNTVHAINGDGIFVKNVTNVDIDGNTVTDTRGNGVSLTYSNGNLNVRDNKIGAADDATNIDGNGVYLTGLSTGTVLGNTIYNTQASNPIDGDDASGVYLDHVSNIIVGGTEEGQGNFIRGADWDGVKVADGSNNQVIGNDIANSTRIGIYGEGTHSILIDSNKVSDSNLEGFGGITILGGENQTVTNNTISDLPTSKADAGIFMSLINSGINTIAKNIVSAINGDGIFVKNVTNVDIDSNTVTDTRGNGISLTYSNGNLKVTNNKIGDVNDATKIDGNGIYLTGLSMGTVQGNTIYNTQASNPFDGDDASGIYLDHVSNIVVGGLGEGEGNFIRNADWDGVKVADGSNNLVQGNDIASSTRIGIYGEGTHSLSVLDNRVFDSNLDGYGGITLLGGENHQIGRNTVSDDTTSGTDHGIYVALIGDGTTNIFDNTVFAINNGDGIHAEQVAGQLNITGNSTANVGSHGISADTVDDVFIDDNSVDLSGIDGVHVAYFDTALITNNTVSRSGDDGIEAHDGHAVEIDGNNVSESGIGTIVEGEEPEDYEGYDEFNGGHDGISVRRISGTYDFAFPGEGDVSFAALELPFPFFNYTPGSIRITNNVVVTEDAQSAGVSTSGDDGIEVVDADAYLYITGNNVENSGVDSDGNSFGDYDDYGADGIHVRNVFASDDFGSQVREGDIGNGEYNIVVANNTVNNSLDDGIEIIGSNNAYDDSGVIILKALISEEEEYDDEDEAYEYGTTGRVLVSNNIVSNSGYGTGDGFGTSFDYASGGDGIHVENVYANGYYNDGPINAGAVGTGEFAGYAVDIIGNNVSNSGDDGIEVEYASSTLISGNTVTNSGFASDDDGGDVISRLLAENDFSGADGISVNNVGDGYDDVIFNISAGGLEEGGVFTPYSVVVNGNNVSNSLDDGIQVNNTMWQENTDPVLVQGNTVTSSGSHGLYASGFAHNNVIVSNNNFSGFDIGGEFESGLIDLTGPSNSFSNGRVGLRFAPYGYVSGDEGSDEGMSAGRVPAFAKILLSSTYLDLVDDDGLGSTPYPDTPTNFGGTIGAQTFTNISQYYVELGDGAFTNGFTPVWLNGLNSTYDGVTPSSFADNILDQLTYDNLEAKFFHFIDQDDRDVFFFGTRALDDTALIDQSDIFNQFGAFNGDVTGLNVQIRGLPTIPGGGNRAPVAQNFNDINTFAGGDGTTDANGADPGNLNNIQTAAGGLDSGTIPATPGPQDLNNVEAQAGGDNQACWSNAVNAAGGGQVVNVVYNGSFDDNLTQAASCGGTF